MATTYWKSFASYDALGALAEQEQINSVEYREADIFSAFGLPASMYSQVGICDQATFSKKVDGGGATKLAQDVVQAFGTVAGSKFTKVPPAASASVMFQNHTQVVVLNATDKRRTFDNLQNFCDCYQINIVSRHPDGQKHMPVVFFYWVYRNYEESELKVVLVETAKDYRPLLRQHDSALAACVRTVSALHVLSLTANINNQLFALVPWEANKLLNAAVGDVRGCFEGGKSANSYKLKKGSLAMADVYPLFVYTTNSGDYEEAVRVAADSEKPVRYVRYWHEFSDIEATLSTHSAVCTAQSGGDVLPASVLMLATNGGKQITAACVAVRVRETGRYLYVTQRAEKALYELTERTGVVPEARSELLERSFAVDNWGSAIMVNAKSKPVSVHTGLTNAIRHAMLGVPETRMYVKHVHTAMTTMDCIAKRVKGMTFTWEHMYKGVYMDWTYPKFRLSGKLYISHAVTPGPALLGVLSPWQNINGPGSGYKDYIQTNDYWYPADGRSGVNRYTAMMYLDMGLSLLGRYVVHDCITPDYLLDSTKLLLPHSLRDDGLINELQTRYDVGPDMQGKVDVVMDIEYADLPGGTSKMPTALGIVAADNGELRVHGTTVMIAAEMIKEGLLQEQAGRLQPQPRLVEGVKTHVGKYVQLSKSAPAADIWQDLLALNVLRRNCYSLKVWAKGADNDAAFLGMAVGPGKLRHTWGEAKKIGKRLIDKGDVIDLGAEMPKFAKLAQLHKLSSEHHPGVEAALFLAESGLWRKNVDLKKARYNRDTTSTSVIEWLYDKAYRLDVLDREEVEPDEWLSAILDDMDKLGMPNDYPAYEWVLLKRSEIAAMPDDG